MKRLSLLILAGTLLTFSVRALHAETPAAGSHVPQAGDLVVTYRNEFKPENFAEATKVLSDRLKQMVFEDAAVRDSYVLKDEKTSTVLAVVMWDSKKDYEAWKASGKGKEMAKPLEAFQAKPVEIQEFELFLFDDE